MRAAFLCQPNSDFFQVYYYTPKKAPDASHSNGRYLELLQESFSSNHLFLVHQAERLRKTAEQERHEAVEGLGAVTAQVATLSQAKKKLEGTVSTLQEEAEDLENEAKNADDRAKKAAIDVMFAFGVTNLVPRVSLLLPAPKSGGKREPGNEVVV